MTKASDVYKTFKSHKDRQESVLASIKAELAETRREFEASSTSLIATFIRIFPSSADLPYDVMQAASRLQNEGVGNGHDYQHMADSLRAQDQRFKAEREALVIEHGAVTEIHKRIEVIDGQSAALTSAAEQADETTKQIRLDLKPSLYRRERLLAHFNESGVEITDKTAPEYLHFRLGKILFSPEWRSGCKAVISFYLRDGQSIDADVTDFAQKQARLQDLETESRSATAQIAANVEEKKRLREITAKMTRLYVDQQGEAGIHKTICANFVDVLRNDEAAQYVGQNLSNDKAEPLMIEALKYRNLKVIYDNLQTLRVAAENALTQVSQPMRKLKELVDHAPSKSIAVDLDKVSGEYRIFNQSATGYLGMSQTTRQALGQLSLGTPSNNVISGVSDDSYLMTNMMLANIIAANGNTVTAHLPLSMDFSSALQGCTIPNTAIHVPDFGSALHIPACDLGHIHIPAVEIHHHSTTHSVFDHGGGGFAHTGFDAGSMGGHHITAEDLPRRGSWNPERAQTMIYATV